MTRDIVSLESDRLIQRPLTAADAPDIFREFTPEISALMVPAPPETLAAAEAFVARAAERAPRTRLSAGRAAQGGRSVSGLFGGGGTVRPYAGNRHLDQKERIRTWVRSGGGRRADRLVARACRVRLHYLSRGRAQYAQPTYCRILRRTDCPQFPADQSVRAGAEFA